MTRPSIGETRAGFTTCATEIKALYDKLAKLMADDINAGAVDAEDMLAHLDEAYGYAKKGMEYDPEPEPTLKGWVKP